MHRFRIDDFPNFTNAQYFYIIEIPIRKYETLKFGPYPNSGEKSPENVKVRRQPVFVARSPCSGQSGLGDHHQTKARGLRDKAQSVRRRETAGNVARNRLKVRQWLSAAPPPCSGGCSAGDHHQSEEEVELDLFRVVAPPIAAGIAVKGPVALGQRGSTSPDEVNLCPFL